MNGCVSGFMSDVGQEIKVLEYLDLLVVGISNKSSIYLIDNLIVGLNELADNIKNNGNDYGHDPLEKIGKIIESLKEKKENREPLMFNRAGWVIEINDCDLPMPVKVVLSDLLYHLHDPNYLLLADDYSLAMVSKYLNNGFTLDFDFHEIVVIESVKRKDRKYFKLINHCLPYSYCPRLRSLGDIEVVVISDENEDNL